MNFDSFFKDFFESNVGGPGAQFCASDKLEDLGFSNKDAAKLKTALGVANDIPLDARVQDVKKMAGPGVFEEKKKVGKSRTVFCFVVCFLFCFCLFVFFFFFCS
jgi:hypothetical protein